MVWFMVDDSFESHPKVRRIPRAKRLRAVGLWTTAGNWCARHLTDGRFPSSLLDDWSATSADVDALLSATLWERDGDDFLFHDWSDWNETREVVESRRAAKRRAGAAGGKASGKQRRSKAEADASLLLEQNEAARFAGGEPPTLPIPTTTKTPPSTPVDDEFVAFWHEYPRKVSKADAVKAYAKARKKASAAEILAALRSQLPKFKASDPQFVPHAAKWLNAERWQDETPGELRYLPDGQLDLTSLPPVEDTWMRRKPQ